MKTYKQHYACFKCRKAFKRRRMLDMSKKLLPNVEEPAKCPDCGAPMADMGRDFKAPKKTDIKNWSHLEMLYEGGVTFHACKYDRPFIVPKDKESLLRHMEARRRVCIDGLKNNLHALENLSEDQEFVRERLEVSAKSWSRSLKEVEEQLEKVSSF